MTTLSGPMFEAAEGNDWKSSFQKQGAHYNIFRSKTTSMECLRELFPDGKADELNFCLFSTSGVHGTYGTIEDAEKLIESGSQDDREITFLVVHPRLVCMRYGNCHPQTKGDIEFLKTLRESSWQVVQTIGKHSDL